jgi:hypothetical protein
MMRGLEKNSFAMFDYSIARVLGMTLVVLAGRCWPVLGLFVTSGAAWWCNLGTIVAALLLHVEMLRITGWSPRLLWWWPLSGPAMQYILWRGVLLTIRRGGVNWRGTLYPLKELKRARAQMN